MILLTGSNGFLGKIIVNKITNNQNLIYLSRTSGDYKISLENEVPSFNHKFDLVIHAAGKAHSIPKTHLEEQLFHDVNVKGTRNLLKGLEKLNPPKSFVFISSVSVYGQEFGENINEDFPLQAKDSYGLSKIEAEKIVQEWCCDQNVICTILRLPLLVGENPPGNLGAMLRAINKGYYFNICGGRARKSMVLANDVAAFIPTVANIGGIYNLTDGYHPNFHELSTLICKNRNKKTPLNMPSIIAQLLGLIGDVIGKCMPLNTVKLKKITSDLTFDDSKAREIAGWNPNPVLNDLNI
jgi:nucleoside-diphosphate-sugar epimerase